MSLKYSEWRSQVLEQLGQPFKSVKELAKVNLEEFRYQNLEGGLGQEAYYPWVEKFVAQINHEQSKAQRKGKEEEPEEVTQPIVELTQPPEEPHVVQTEEEEIAELVQLSKTGQIKLPNVTHVPGRTYPELKKIKQEKKGNPSSTQKPPPAALSAEQEHAVLNPGPKYTYPKNFLVPYIPLNLDIWFAGFALGVGVSALIHVFKSVA